MPADTLTLDYFGETITAEVLFEEEFYPGRRFLLVDRIDKKERSLLRFVSDNGKPWRIWNLETSATVELRGMHAEVARLTALIAEADRNRDAMWCKALTVLDPKEIHAATKAFNELRARRGEG
jgi:hypothetical protein